MVPFLLLLVLIYSAASYAVGPAVATVPEALCVENLADLLRTLRGSILTLWWVIAAAVCHAVGPALAVVPGGAVEDPADLLGIHRGTILTFKSIAEWMALIHFAESKRSFVTLSKQISLE